MNRYLRTSLCDTLGIEHPIWLAGMGSQGRATPPALVAAVSNAGGLGVIGGANLSPSELRRVIREVRALTARPIGVHLIMPAKHTNASPNRADLRKQLALQYPQHVAELRRLMAEFRLTPHQLDADVAVSQAATADGGVAGPRGTPEAILEQQLDVVFSEDVQVVGGAMGPVDEIAKRARGRNVQVLALATSLTQAMRFAEQGATIIVAQGAEAGGHIGRIGTFALLPQVVDAVKVPVLAAGGISDGRGVAASLAFGAAGVWIGTAFLVATECAIPEAHKQQIIAGRSEDFSANRIYSGLPMRGFRNAVIEAWEASGLTTLPSPYQKVLMDDFNAAAAAAGRWDLHNNPAGEGAGLLKSIRPAAEIVNDMVRGACQVLSLADARQHH